MHAREMRAREMRAREMRAREMRAREMRAREMRAREMHARPTRLAPLEVIGYAYCSRRAADLGAVASAAYLLTFNLGVVLSQARREQ